MAEFRYAECHCAECHNLFIGMLNAVLLSVVVTSIATLDPVCCYAVLVSLMLSAEFLKSLC